jgi:hypothetical protein
MKLIGWKLSFHFRLKQVPKEDLLNSLVAKYDKHTLCIYYDDLRDTLAEMPFSVSDKTELEMLTRYLIEDEDEEEEADENSKQSISIVKSIFNKLLGSYEGKTEREYNYVNNTVLQMIDRTSAYGRCREILLQIRRPPSDQNIKLPNYELEHILWRLFLESRNIKRLNLKNLYKILRKKEKKNARGIVVEFKIGRPRLTRKPLEPDLPQHGGLLGRHHQRCRLESPGANDA